MVIAALVSFGILLVAWIAAPERGFLDATEPQREPSEAGPRDARPLAA